MKGVLTRNANFDCSEPSVAMSKSLKSLKYK